MKKNNTVAQRLVYLTHLARSREVQDVWQVAFGSFLPMLPSVWGLMMHPQTIRLHTSLCAFGSETRGMTWIFGTAPFIPGLHRECTHQEGHPGIGGGETILLLRRQATPRTSPRR